MTADIDLIAEQAAASIARVCAVLGRPRSTYYQRKSRSPSLRALARAQLEVAIAAVYKENRGRYGSPRVHAELVKTNRKYSEGHVARTMQRLGLRAKQRRRFRNTSASNPAHLPSENLLERNFTAEKPNQIWVGDVTAIRTKAGWAYLALLKDMFCQTIVGWAVSTSCDEELARRALEQAIARRQPSPGLIHHTDRGSTYTATKYRQRLKQLRIRQSMSRKGDCWDNAPAESLNGTIKREALGDSLPLDSSHVRTILFDYIEAYYNTRRLHSSISYLSPRAKLSEFLRNQSPST